MAVLTEAQIGAELRRLPGWGHRDNALEKRYTFPNFTEALAFVNRVGEAAEGMDHHPDIDIRYNAVRLALSTHSEGGVTEKDVKLARKIEDIAADWSR